MVGSALSEVRLRRLQLLERELEALHRKSASVLQPVDEVGKVARRAQQAEEKIAQAEAAALKEVRDQAVDVALAAAAKLIAGEVKPAKAKALIDQSIDELSSKLN